MGLELTIVTPEGQTFSGEVEQAVLPGAEGDFGVLELHERFLAPLRHGAIEIRSGDSTQFAAVSDGIADVSAQQVVVMADYCALAGDIDTAMVEQERAEAEAALEALGLTDDATARRAELEEMLVRYTVWIEVSRR